MKSFVVIDSSIILKWVLIEEPAQELDMALRLRDAAVSGDIELAVPDLWLYEAANVLTRRSPKTAREKLGTLIAFGLSQFQIRDDSEWLEEAVALTEKFAVTIYDAAYHSLALVKDGIFVTADSKYFQKTRSAGSVIRLTDWR